ncbi:unnamed protein product [Closterium sp. NIES-54]
MRSLRTAQDSTGCYSSPATAALGRLLLPYLFPEMFAFATVEDLVSHLRASDARYRATLPAKFLDRNLPPMYITLYFIVTRLPDSLRSVRDHFLSLDPTSLTVDLLEQHLLAAETRAVAVGAACGTPCTPFIEGCSPSPLAPSYTSAAAVNVLSTEDVGAASASAKRRSSKGKGGRGGGGGSGGGGGGSSGGAGGSGGGGSGGSGGGSGGVGGGGGGSGGSGGSGSGGSGGGRIGAQRGGFGGGQRQRQQRRSETPSPQKLREWLFQCGMSGCSVTCPYVIRTSDRAGQTCGKAQKQHRCFSRLDDAWRAEFGDEGDCYQCVLPDPGIDAAALGASESVLPGTVPAQALHTFTQDSGASRCFFRDSTTLTPLPPPLPVRLANPYGDPVVAHSSTVLPCPADAMVTTTTPGGQCVSICTCTRTGRHLAMFTCRPGSSLCTLATEPPQVAASAQVSTSGQVPPPCSCRLLSHQTLLWHHRLGHPSLPCLRGMHSRLLVSGLPRSLPPLLPSRAPPCLPCVEGRQRATPHSSSFPLTTAPLQTLHMDVWGPARVSGQGRERYFLLVVDDYTRYTMVFPLRSKGQVVDVLIRWIRAFSSDLLRDFCRGEGILQSFTLPDSPQKNGIAEHRIGLVMEVARTSMIHAAAPHFLWPFAVWYAVHQLNLWLRVSFPETSPTLRWTGKVGDALVFRVCGARAFVRNISADKLSACAIHFVFHGFTPDARGWQFYHSTSRHVFPSQDVTFDEVLPPQRGAASRGVEPGVAESEGARSGGAEPGGSEPAGVEPGGAESEGAESGGAEPQGAALSGGRAGASPRLSPQQLPGGAGVPAGDGDTRGAAATEPGGARARAGAGGTGAGGAGAEGAGAVDPGGTPASPLPACTARSVSPVRTARRIPRSRPPSVPGTHAMTIRPSSVPLHVPLPAPPESSLPAVPDPEFDRARATSPIISHLLATAVTDPSFESAAASALVAELLDFAAACHLDYATALVAESASASPPSVGGECALGTNVLEDRQEEFECFAAAVSCFSSMLLAPEGDPDEPDILTTRSYAEAITGPYSSQWQAAMDADMASWKSTGTNVDEVPPPGANIVVASGFSGQRQRVDYFHTLCPTPKMTTLRVLLHVTAQRDYELHSLDFSTAFLQGSLHDEIWLRRPPGFTGSFPAGTQWSLRWPVYGLCQAPRKWHDTLRTTLAALGFAPTTADPSLFLRTDTSLPPFYVLVYVDDLVFATADTEALTLVNSELEKRHICTDLGELRSYLGLQITRDRARRTITLNQSHMVHQVLQRFGFQFSSPQPTPLSIGQSLSAPPSDESVEPSGPYPELVHWDATKRVLRYLCSTSGMGLVLGGRGPIVLTGHVDASWVDDSATQRSSQVYTFTLGSGSVSWRSTRSSSVLSSSCEAEIYAGAMAAQELRWLTYLLTDLGEQLRSPPVLYLDNKAMIALCQEHRLEHRTKHIALRYFLARELQQRGQLRLAYMATWANTTEIFTKALPPFDHQRFSTVQGSGDAAEKKNEPPPSKIEALDGSNYEEYSGRMRSGFKCYKLLKIAMGEEKMPEEGDARDRWIEKSAVLYDLVLQSVNNDMFQHIKDLVELDDSGPKAWKLLRDVIQPNTLPMVIVLEKELAALSMRPGDDVKPVLDKIKDTYARMAAAGSNVSQMQQCTKIISVLDNSWDNLIPTLNTQQDQWTPEWLRQQILQEDFRRRHTGGGAANKTAEGYGVAGGTRGRGGGRGRGRGRGFGRGRGRGCTSDMTPRADLLDEVKPPGKTKFVAAASGALLPVIGVGNAKKSKAKVTFGPTSCRAKLGKLLLWDLEEKRSCIKDLWQLPIIPWNEKPPATAAAAVTAKTTTEGEETTPTNGALDAVKKVRQSQQPDGEVLAGVDATAAWAKASSGNVPYNPQQNGVAERFNRTLQEGARTLLGRAGLPDPFWVTALRHVALVKKRVLASVGDKQWVPYTKWYGSAPAVNMLRAYGCMVVFHVPKEKRGKLEASGRWGVQLGLAKDHKGWLIWDLTSQQLTVSRDVKFLESLYYKEWKQQQQKLPTTPLIIEADEVQRPSRQMQVTVLEEEISGVTEDGGEPEVEQQQQQQQQQDAPQGAARPADRPRRDVRPPNRLTYPSFGKPKVVRAGSVAE